MKTLIRKLLREVRTDPGDVSEDLGLFIDRNNFTLYNPKEKKVYAYMGIYKLKSGNYSVGGVAAEYGYGPLIYELVMSHIYPKALLPARDGDIRGGSINIWNRFLKRPDVEKKSLTKKDPDFSWEVYEEFGSGPGFKFIQTSYYYSGLKDLVKKLTKKANEYTSNGLDLKEVIDSGGDYWMGRYD